MELCKPLRPIAEGFRRVSVALPLVNDEDDSMDPEETVVVTGRLGFEGVEEEEEADVDDVKSTRERLLT